MTDNIDVYMSARSFGKDELLGKTAVVIDVLRASSTIVTALHHGAKEVIPVENRRAAENIFEEMDSSECLLCGEEEGKKLEGFDLGNSPLDYSPEVVTGKTIILTTSNGTKAVHRAGRADTILIGCFLNLNRVVAALRETSNAIALVCAGWRGRLSLEDLLCAGNIIYELTNENLPKEAQDGTKVAFGLYEKFGNDVKGVLRTSNHAQRLQHLTENDDIGYCSVLNGVDLLPVLNEGVITRSHVKK